MFENGIINIKEIVKHTIQKRRLPKNFPNNMLFLDVFVTKNRTVREYTSLLITLWARLVTNSGAAMKSNTINPPTYALSPRPKDFNWSLNWLRIFAVPVVIPIRTIIIRIERILLNSALNSFKPIANIVSPLLE